jgi:Protein of unknown function (DUF1761)
MLLSNINWIAVAIGAVFNMILGTLWYGVFFGKKWLELMEKSKEDFEGGNSSIYVVTFIASVVSAVVLALIISGLGIKTWYGGLITGGLIWLGIGSVAILSTALYEGRKAALWVLFSLYQLVVYAVQGIIFAIW